MSLHRHRLSSVVLVVLTAVAFVLVGCSSGSGGSSGSGDRPGSTAAGQTHYPLTITQPDGTTAVLTKAPTRIVTLDQPAITIDEVMALGVVPIGGELNTAASGFGAGEFDSRGLPVWDSSRITSFTSIGVPFTADLEKVLSLHPDLIVGYSGASTTALKQLEAIAPVYSVPLQNAPPASVTGIQRLAWYPAVAGLAKVLDRQAEFTAFVQRFEAAANAARPILHGRSVSMLIVFNNAQQIQVYGPTYYDGVTLSYLGLTVAPIPAGGTVQKDSNNDGTNVSLEHAGDLTGDYLMFATFAPGVSQQFLANPVVQALPSVRAGRVIDASTNTAFYGFPSTGCIEQLNLIPKLADAFQRAGTGS